MQMIKRPRVLLEGKTRFSLNPLVVIHGWSPGILAAREIKERKKKFPFELKSMYRVSHQVSDEKF